MCTSCPRKKGIPCRPPLAIQKLSLELANLPHSLCQERYSGLLSSLICYGSGVRLWGFVTIPEATEQGFGAFIW